MSRLRASRWTIGTAMITLAAATACVAPGALRWEDVRPLDGALSDRSMLVMRADSSVALATSPDASVAPPGAVCRQSVRVASDGQGTLFAVWWAPKDDSSSVLMVARRSHPGSDSAVWASPVIADARDASRMGCDRPAPAIAADGATGYVHLAYFLDSPTDGRGVYGGHSMDRGAYFHGPVPVVFGDRPVRTAIDNSGDLVAVAYEDPNSERARVAVAVSVTAGHIFEHRAEASPSTMRASNPVIAIAGRRIAVGWSAEEWEKGARGSRPLMRIAALAEGARGVWTEEGE
jgi:hypothetical protein